MSEHDRKTMDVTKLARGELTGAARDEAMAHLDDDRGARRAYEGRVLAERAMAGDLEVPSAPEADMLLDEIFARADIAPAKEGLLARLLKSRAIAFSVPVAAAAAVLLVVSMPAGPGDDGFRARGNRTPSAALVGVRVFCNEGAAVRLLEPPRSCSAAGTLVVAARLPPGDMARAHLFLRPATGDLVAPAADTPTSLSAGVSLGSERAPAEEHVLEHVLPLVDVPPGPADLFTVFCPSCDRGAAAQLIERGGFDAGASEATVHVLRIDVAAVRKEAPP